MNNCSPWIHEVYQGIFEICTDLGILVVNAKYAQKYTVAYTRFFAQCCMIESSLGNGGTPIKDHLSSRHNVEGMSTLKSYPSSI